jgi:3-dehydroquinate synthase
MIHNHINISNIEDSLSSFLSNNNYSKIAILVDNNSKFHCLQKINHIVKNSNIIEIKSGEINKNINTCISVWNSLTNLNFDRKSLLINLGGGVICDLGGFIAATYMRGIDFINIPTTLLSQVDASVGGKLGIDFNNYKNQIGVFLEPNKVLVDTSFLSTLSTRELRSGFAEVIKHCLIKDEDQFNKILKNDWKKNDWIDIVKHSISIKSKIVDSDLKEKGIRKILNFGHTIGHAIESTFLNSKNNLLHGEAIAIGMICESYISYLSKSLNKNELEKITEFIINTFDPIKIKFLNKILDNVIHDKKNINNEINICFLNRIGNCNYDFKVTPKIIKKSLEYYNKSLK